MVVVDVTALKMTRKPVKIQKENTAGCAGEGKFCGNFRTNCAENIVLEINGNIIAEPRLKVVFHISETSKGSVYNLGWFARLEGSGWRDIGNTK